MTVRQDCFKERTLLQAWKKSGAWPINPNVFTDNDFAPSIPYSTHVHDLPATFPSSNSKHLQVTSADPDNPCPDSISDLESDSSSDNNLDDDDDSDNNNNNNRQTALQTHPSGLPTSVPIDTPQKTHTSTQNHHTLRSLPQPPGSGCSLTTPPHHSYGSETFDYIAHLEKKVDFYKTHCTMLEVENQNLKRKVNQQDNAWSSKKRKVFTNAQMLTSDEGLQLAEKQEEEQRIKKQKKNKMAQQ